ncbi:MAG: hypothetical protein QOE77_2841 [Blastocatellia bacterium]|jgi:hypothetical protein|nr:hypothetical protein [Blastocatellia bacterium]
MLRRPTENGITQAARRPLKIFASDPLLGRTFGNRARIDIVNEPLQVGPIGSRLEVIDYDGAQDCFYSPVNLDLPAILMQGGLDPSESDPRFHQQMVYAVAQKTLENFDRALGRVLRLGSHSRKRGTNYPRLRLFPHAFYGANAFYSMNLNAILFGYFKADAADVGPNLPGQTVFTCLSHDVITHEMTHAIVDRLRPLFLEPSNIDVLAFHEGFADIVALFQHFSFQDILREQLQRTRLDVRTSSPLVQLARQFGFATGGGKALRSALDEPNTKLSDSVSEPHDRGSILVAAVFDGFSKTYQRRITDLLRIATGGTGTLPQGDLHPDLVNRIATEAARTAQRVLDMCIRAFDYMPPVDVTFGDFLRAMITADFELVPDDEFNLRDAMIEAFRLRGIFPEGVNSLAEESLLWDNVENKLPILGGEVPTLLEQVFFNAVRSFDTGWQDPTYQPDIVDPTKQYVSDDEGEEIELDVNAELGSALHAYATANKDQLALNDDLKIQVRGFHPVFRVAPNGRLLVELVVQYAQVDHSVKDQLGGIPFRGGCTLIASSNGKVRYLISKPMRKAGGDPSRSSKGKDRFGRQQDYLKMCDMQNALTPYYTAQEYPGRMLELMNFANLHGG